MRRRLLFIGVALTTLLTLVGGGIANASWQAATTATVSASAATASVTAASTTGSLSGVVYTAANVATLSRVTVTDTGTAPLALALSVSGATTTNATTLPLSSIGLAAWTETTCTTPSNWGTLAAPPTIPAGASSAVAGGAAQLCLATRFTGTYASARGQSVTASLVFTGSVGSWSATASVPLSQSIRVGDVTGLTCSSATYDLLLDSQGTLSWTAVPGTGVSYRVVYATGGAVVTPTSSTATSQTFRYADLAGATNALLVQSVDSFGSVSDGVAVTLKRASLLSLGVLIFQVSC